MARAPVIDETHFYRPSLHNPHWSFNDLLKPFREALTRSLASAFDSIDLNTLPTHQLSALRYGLITQGQLAAPESAALLVSHITSGTILDDNAQRHVVVRDTLESIRLCNESLWNLCQAVIERFILVEDQFGAASSPKIFGCIVICPKFLELPLEKRIFSLIHELAHQELFLINTCDRLVAQSLEHHLIYSPFQDALRPPIGRLHAAHAIFRMMQYKDILPAVASQIPESFFEDYPGQFKVILGDLVENKELTPFALKELVTVYEKYI